MRYDEFMYRLIDHTGDAAIEVSGKTLEELFMESANALFHILLSKQENTGSPSEVLDITLEANDLDQLLVVWLSELLYRFDTGRLVTEKTEIFEISPQRLKARIWGSALDPTRHRILTEIKAVTYHGLKIEHDGTLYRTRVIFDL